MNPDWERFTVVMPRSGYQIFETAMSVIAQEGRLPDELVVARGLVVEWTAADFLAGRYGYTVHPHLYKLPPGNWSV